MQFTIRNLVILIYCIITISCFSKANSDYTEILQTTDSSIYTSLKEDLNSTPQSNLTPEIELGLFIENGFYEEMLIISDNNVTTADHIIFSHINAVQDIFHHTSLESKIQLIVTHYHLIDESSTFYKRLINSHSNQELSSNFCRYLRRINLFQLFDIGVLMVRSNFNIFYEADTTLTLGGAFHDSICTTKACAVVIFRPSIFKPYVIAHEIGHILGLKHDEDYHECETSENKIMSKIVDSVTEIKSWSSCSSNLITEILQSQSKPCLFNESEKADLKVNFKYQGQYFTRRQQCQMLLSDPDVDFISVGLKCKQLFCKKINSDNGSMIQIHAGRPMNGTPCTKNKNRICMNGQCMTKPLDFK